VIAGEGGFPCAAIDAFVIEFGEEVFPDLEALKGSLLVFLT